MISLINVLPVGNALRISLLPITGAVYWRLLRRLDSKFAGEGDPNATVVYEGDSKSILDSLGLKNGIETFYRAYYHDGIGWIGSSSAQSAIPTASFADLSPNPLLVVRDRLALGLDVYIERGLLRHPLGAIPVLTASPIIDQVVFPIVTVHLASDGSVVRAAGEGVSTDVYASDLQTFDAVEGYYSHWGLTIVGWTQNGDERIALRTAVKAILIANFPVFDAAGLLTPDISFSTDMDDFQSFSTPIYRTECTFGCLAMSAVSGFTPVITDVSLTQTQP
jgi:hypothetical protein